MKKTLLFLPILLFTFITGYCQTSVSGGLYSNTTWTLANSPYIVTSNMVLFPGNTLTIEPGVTVKFASGVQLEIRGASLMALGTSTDSITFTTNGSASAGSWNQVVLTGGPGTSKFTYCNFRYATRGLFDSRGGAGDTLIIQNSNFSYNTDGFDGQGSSYVLVDFCDFSHNSNYGVTQVVNPTFNHCNFSYNTGGIQGRQDTKLLSCTIHHNQTGIDGIDYSVVSDCDISNNQTGIVISNSNVVIRNSVIDSNTMIGIKMFGQERDTITNNEIAYNGIGIKDQQGGTGNVIARNIIENNSTGIQLSATEDAIFCNRICGNSLYNLDYIGFNNVNVANNYWCTTDSAVAAGGVRDGYDDITVGLANFMPLDVVQCYLQTGINDPDVSDNTSFRLYPNPFVNSTTLEFSTTHNQNLSLTVYDIQGRLMQSITGITGNKLEIQRNYLTSGIYFYQLQTNRQTIASGKMIVE